MSPPRLDCVEMPGWPPLAWLATMRPGDPRIELRHGRHLEIAPEFACEAVWDGPFEHGGFDATDIVAGSGVRLRGEEAVFVSSGNTVDRLVSLEGPGATRVSNSLVCLLAAVGGRLDPAYPDYFWDFYSIMYGLERYKRELETSAGSVELTYFHNLAWDGRALALREKPFPRRDFSSYERYLGQMSEWMQAVAGNLADQRRRRPMRLLGTLSSGYDSPALSVLAREVGLEEVLCFDRARGGMDDSGEAIARQLGLKPLVVSSESWKRTPFAEVPFIAANGLGEEVHVLGAAEHLPGRVLLTGHNANGWMKEAPQDHPQLERVDPSGLGATEYRLQAGFINCSVPFWGARDARQLLALGNSDEMRPWDVPGYSKPIPRRIAEEAGIAREAFGTSKKAAAVLMHKSLDFLTPESMDDYLAWLRQHAPEFLRARRLPPLPSRTLDTGLARAQLEARRGLRRARRTPSLQRLPGLDLAERLVEGPGRGGMPPSPRYLRRYTMPWALERAKSAYAEGSGADERGGGGVRAAAGRPGEPAGGGLPAAPAPERS